MDDTLPRLPEYPLARAYERRLGRRIGRPARTIAAAAAATGALALLFASAPRNGVIRADLESAAASLNEVPQNADPARVVAALAGEFPGENAKIDPTQFPAAVAVTLHGIDHAGCANALRTARRLEGRVVVELKGYQSSADCGDSNDMTWWLMP